MAEGFFSREAGQKRRAALEQGLMHYVPPELRGWLGAASMFNPVTDMEQAGQKARIVASPDATGQERFNAGVGMVTDMATVVAPAYGASKVGTNATAATIESLLGFGAPAREGLQDAGRRFAADESGALFPQGATLDEVFDFSRSGDAIYHSGPVDAAEEMHKWGVDPMSDGPWVREVAQGAVDDVDEFLSQNPAAAWWDDAPRWVKAKVARASGKSQSDVTIEDIRKHGHLAIASASDYGDEAFRIGEDGLMNGEYSEVTSLAGDRMKLYETPLYEVGDDGVGRYPFGIEVNEIVTGSAIEPRYTLTGDELVDFLSWVDNPAARGASTPSKADEIARLLREGRAEEITDDMMAVLDPNDQMRLFKLYEDGATGMPMPMDEASRMARAREMGFDADLYHGTDGELRGAAFDNYASGRVDSGYLGRGTYASEAPRIASGYASRKADMPGASDAPNVMPISVRQGNQLSITPEVKQELSGLDPYDRMDWGFDRQRDGFNSIRVNYGQKRGSNADEVVTFDPRDIRSRFARFDPRLKHLANLSAGVGGAAYLGNQGEDEKAAQIRAYLEGL